MKQDLYHWLYQADLFRENFVSYIALKNAMLNIIKFYETVHTNSSKFVGPVNLHKMFIDPENGRFEVEGGKDYIHDIDSIKFMPSEILNGQNVWNIESDRFVLSELLFILKFLKHPFDGKKTLKNPITDSKKAKIIYANCKFIFDPESDENGLEYSTDPEPIDAWKNESDDALKDMFVKSFTLGFLNPNCRLSDRDWKNIISKTEILCLH